MSEHETQESMGRWAEEQFPGFDPKSSRTIRRLIEEVAELARAFGLSQSELYHATERAYDGMRIHESHPEPDKIADEAADVNVTLNVLAYRYQFDLELHLRKIDLANEILVINKDGYVGESTRREIDYADRTGKRIRYLFPEEKPELSALDSGD